MDIKRMAEELLRLAALSGNCGRVIARFIERYLTVQATGCELAVKAPQIEVKSALEFAMVVAYAREEAVRIAQEIALPWLTLEVFAHRATWDISYLLRFASLPASVNERRKVLKGLGDALSGFAAEHGRMVCDVQGTLSVVRHLYLGTFRGNESADDVRIFNELMRGVFVEVEKCDRRLVALAAVLDPQVASVVGEGYDLSLCGLSAQQLREIEEEANEPEAAVA